MRPSNRGCLCREEADHRLGKRGNGAQGRNRTTDTAIFSRMLYQLSYLGMLDMRAKEMVKAHRAGGL